MMKLTCMFSFILLFGAAGLVVFIHLQDPEEIVHQQTPGYNFFRLSSCAFLSRIGSFAINTWWWETSLRVLCNSLTCGFPLGKNLFCHQWKTSYV